ncbi:MAG: ATP-binding protein [Chloroflexi bacterium]|nr:ATP-binding protein [Chloroflexota bacterium]
MPFLSIPARYEYLDEIREFVAGVAGQSGFGEKEVYSLQLAADEAATNIIEHAYAGMSNGTLEVSCNLQGDSLVIVMRDYGKTFDPSKVRQPDVTTNLSKRQIGGLGIYLMRKLMDEVHYESIGNQNILTMTKRRG